MQRVISRKEFGWLITWLIDWLIDWLLLINLNHLIDWKTKLLLFLTLASHKISVFIATIFLKLCNRQWALQATQNYLFQVQIIHAYLCQNHNRYNWLLIQEHWFNLAWFDCNLSTFCTNTFKWSGRMKILQSNLVREYLALFQQLDKGCHK